MKAVMQLKVRKSLNTYNVIDEVAGQDACTR